MTCMTWNNTFSSKWNKVLFQGIWKREQQLLKLSSQLKIQVKHYPLYISHQKTYYISSKHSPCPFCSTPLGCNAVNSTVFITVFSVEKYCFPPFQIWNLNILLPSQWFTYRISFPHGRLCSKIAFLFPAEFNANNNKHRFSCFFTFMEIIVISLWNVENGSPTPKLTYEVSKPWSF